MMKSTLQSPILQALLRLVVILLLPVLLALLNTRLIMTDVYLQLEYNKADFPEDPYGLTLQDRLHYAPFVMQYLFNSEGQDYLGKLTFPVDLPLFTERELSHMADVKSVFQSAMAALLIVSLLFLLIVISSIFLPILRRPLRDGLFGGSFLILILLVGIVFFLLSNWDTFFSDFHNLFFAQGSWVFDYSDTLIRLFPIRFWQDAALTIGGMTAVEAVVILIVMRVWMRQTKARSSQLRAKSG